MNLPVLKFETLEEYLAFIIDFIGAMTGKGSPTLKEKEMLVCLLVCQKLGIVLYSKECSKQLELRGWSSSHVFVYRKLLIKKGWLTAVLEYDKDEMETYKAPFLFADDISALINIENNMTLAFQIQVANLEVNVLG